MSEMVERIARRIARHFYALEPLAFEQADRRGDVYIYTEEVKECRKLAAAILFEDMRDPPEPMLRMLISTDDEADVALGRAVCKWKTMIDSMKGKPEA